MVRSEQSRMVGRRWKPACAQRAVTAVSFRVRESHSLRQIRTPDEQAGERPRLL